MKKAIVAIILIDLSFLLLLIVSGAVTGDLRWAIGKIAYILPIGVGLFMLRRCGLLRESPSLFVTKDKAISSVALFAPTMLVIIAVSALTTLLLSLLGKTNQTDVSGNLFYELFSHALIPAVLEELLFRYIPIKLLSPYSRRGAILVSALLFSLVHLNLFQIPYALLAGVVFGFLTVASGSILPSMLLHLINNAVSVVWMRNPDVAPYVIIAVNFVLCLPSAVCILKRREQYREDVVRAFSGERVGFSPELLVMAIVCIVMSVLSL